MELDVPTSVAYDCYSDREAIPRWMPFISSVKVPLDHTKQLFRSAFILMIEFINIALMKLFSLFEQIQSFLCKSL